MQCPAGQACVHGAFSVMVHCGTETGLMTACTADVDAAPSDGGPRDAAIDAAVDADLDAGADAGTDANLDDMGVDAGT